MSKIKTYRRSDQLREPHVEIWGDLGVPRAFVAEVEEDTENGTLHLTMDIEVETDRPRCRRLNIETTGDVEIAGELLRRIPVARLMLEALSLAVSKPHEVDELPNGLADTLGAQGVTRTWMSPSEEERRSFYEQYASKARRPRRGSPVTDEHLEQVAALYRAAAERGDPPTQTVGETMHVARSTAARWVGLARRRGLLGPSLPGRAGEADGPEGGKS